MEAISVKYGDIVRLHGVNKDVLEEDTPGMITAKGFTDKNLYYIQYQSFEALADYRQSLFEIVPKSSFEIHNQLQKTTSAQIRQTLKQRAKTQQDMLENNANLLRHSDMLNGSEILLKHVNSGEYIKGTFDAAQTGIGSFKLQLTNELSSQLIFKIKSNRSFQRQGDRVFYEDPILLYHIVSDCFLNFNTKQKCTFLDQQYLSNQFDQKDQANQIMAMRPVIRKPSKGAKRFQVINQMKPYVLWKFMIHSDQSTPQNQIKPYDLVYILHTHQNGFLSTDLIKPQIFLKQPSTQFTYFLQAIWQLYPEDDKLYLKHLYTGRLIYAQQSLTRDRFTPSISLPIQQIKDYRIQLVFNQKELINLKYDKLCVDGRDVKVAKDIPEIVQYCNKDHRKIQLVMVDTMQEHGFRIQKIDEQTCRQVLYIKSCQQMLAKYTDVIKVSKQHLKKEQYIQLVLNKLLNQGTKVQVQFSLKKILQLIYNCQFQSILISTQPCQKILNIVICSGTIQLIIQMIYFLSINKNYTLLNLCYRILSSAKDQYSKCYISRYMDIIFTQASQENQEFIFKCLEALLKNNTPAINLFMDQERVKRIIHFAISNKPQVKYITLMRVLCQTNQKACRRNQNCILKNFFANKDNKFNIHFKTQYKNFIGELKAQLDQIDKLGMQKQIYIWLADREPGSIMSFFKNQSQLWNYFAEYVNLMADISMQRNQLAKNHIKSILPLQTILIILSDPNIQKLAYQIKQQNKNIKGNVYLNIYGPIIRVAHHVYIDSIKFHPIKVIPRKRYWNKLTDKEDIAITKRVFEGEKDLQQRRHLKMILSWIKRILKSFQQQKNNVSQIKVLFTILDMLKTSINLGLWQSVEEFRQLVPLLLLNVIKIDSNSLLTENLQKQIDKEQLKHAMLQNKRSFVHHTPQTQLIISCKIKALNILQVMMSMETNIKIANLLYFMKGIDQANVNFQQYSKQYYKDDRQKAEDIVRRQSIAKEIYQANNINKLDQLLGSVRIRRSQKDIMMDERLWLNKIAELIPTSQISLFQKTPQPLFLLSLTQTSQYQSQKLFVSSMSLLTKGYQQRLQLIKNLAKILIIGGKNFYNIYLKIREIRSKFYNMDEAQQEQIWKKYDPTVKEQKKRTGLIQDLGYLAFIMKSDANIKNTQGLMSVYNKSDLSLSSILITNQKQQNNKLFQSLSLLLQIHILLFNYIENLQLVQPGSIKAQLLHASYNYLTMIIWNNQFTKQELLPYISIVYKHLYYQVGCAEFLYQMVTNNKPLIQNNALCEQIIDAVVQTLNQIPSNEYLKSKLIRILKSICLFNIKGVKRIQKSIMCKFQNLKYTNILFTSKIQGCVRMEELTRDLQEYKILYQASLSTFVLPLSPLITYTSNLLQTLSSLIQTRNLINIGKCSNMHPYLFLLGFLKNAEYCWPLVKGIRAYVNRLYYIPVDNDVFLFEEFIRKEFILIDHQLEGLIELNVNHPDFENIQIKTPIRYKYLGSITFCVIQQILIALQQILQKPIFKEMLLQQLNKKQANQIDSDSLHQYIINIGIKLGYFLKYYKEMKLRSKFMISYINQIKRLLSVIIMHFPISYLQDKCGKEIQPDINLEQLPQLSKPVFDYSKSFFRNLHYAIKFINCKRRREDLLDQMSKRQKDSSLDGKNKYIAIIFCGNMQVKKRRNIHSEKAIRKQGIVTGTSRYFKILAKQPMSADEQIISINQKLKQIMNILQYTQSFNRFINQQFFTLVTSFSNLDQISIMYYKKFCQENYHVTDYQIPFVPMRNFILNVISMNQKCPQKIDDSVKISFIKVIRMFITETIQKGQDIKLSVDKWNPEYIQNMADKLVQAQDYLVQCKIPKFITTLLKEPNLTNRIELVNQILELSIAFLFGGNKNSQDAILGCLKQDTDNIMLMNLNQFVVTVGRRVFSKGKIKQSKATIVKNFNITHQDTYDFYNQNDKLMQRKFIYIEDDYLQNSKANNHQNALCRSFRFIQLLCENNNVQMKNYMLAQTNQQGQKKLNSINFIQTTTLLLRKFFKIMNKKLCKAALFLLDFINQTTQIPCINNQICLCKSSFFEDLCYMNQFFESQQNRKIRLFQQEDVGILYEVYNKSIQLTLSNLEGNQDRIYIQLINKLQRSFLTSIILHNLSEISQIQLKQLNKQNLLQLLSRIQAQNRIFNSSVLNILGVFTILKKIQDFQDKMRKLAYRDKQKIDIEKLALAKKANAFIDDFFVYGKMKYLYMHDLWSLISQFPLLLRIQINLQLQGQKNKQYLYFPNYPVFKYLSGQTRNNIMYEVNRQTQRDKLTGLTSYNQDIFNQIQWNYQLNYYNILGRSISITSQKVTDLRISLGTLSLIICFLFTWIVDIDHDMEQSTAYYQNSAVFLGLLLTILSLVQLLGTHYFLLLWLISRAKLALAKQTSDPPNIQTQQPLSVISRVMIMMRSLIQYLCTFKLFYYIFESFHVIKCLGNYQGQFLSIIIFVATSYAGMFLGAEYFTLHAFDFFGREPILQNIFSAIRTGTPQLTIVSLLGVVFIFVFSIISFNIYIPSIYVQTFPQQSCQSMHQCILTLYTSGAINDSMDQFQLIRFFFDMVYFVFMEVLLGNIISGILIDTFSGLKQKRQTVDQDKKNNCFICGKTKADIEKDGQSMTFQKHISNHHLWNYTFYIYCLQKKDSTDYTGIEYDVSNKIKDQIVDWFPLIQQQADIQSKLKGLKQLVCKQSKQSMQFNIKTQRNILQLKQAIV